MSPVQRFDHVGVTVDDLEAVTTFFLKLGLEQEGSQIVEGDWVDTVVGLDDVLPDRLRAAASAMDRAMETR